MLASQCVYGTHKEQAQKQIKKNVQAKIRLKRQGIHPRWILFMKRSFDYIFRSVHSETHAHVALSINHNDLSSCMIDCLLYFRYHRATGLKNQTQKVPIITMRLIQQMEGVLKRVIAYKLRLVGLDVLPFTLFQSHPKDYGLFLNILLQEACNVRDIIDVSLFSTTHPFSTKQSYPALSPKVH